MRGIFALFPPHLFYSLISLLLGTPLRLKPEIAREIARRPCNLAISIDSMIPERYHTLRGVDTLELVKKNLDAAAGHGFSHKGNWFITTTVTKMTELSDVKEIMRFAYDHDMMFAIRPYITVSGTAGKKDEKLTYQYDDVLDIFQYMLERARKENFFASLIYEEHIRYMRGNKMPECDAMNGVSKWMFLMMMFVSFFLGFGKRRGELIMYGISGRKSLMRYSANFLEKGMYTSLTVAIIFYSLMCADTNTIVAKSGADLLWSVPFVVLICFRYMMLVEGTENDGDPVSVLLSDRVLILLCIVFLTVLFILLYFPSVTRFLPLRLY